MEERTEIQDCLYHGATFKAITRQIGKDPTNVSKEVKKHIPSHSSPNRECGTMQSVAKSPLCMQWMPEKRYCKLEKHEYLARPAHEAYRDTRVESRTGIAFTKESFYEDDRIITEGIKQSSFLHCFDNHLFEFSRVLFYSLVSFPYKSPHLLVVYHTCLTNGVQFSDAGSSFLFNYK